LGAALAVGGWWCTFAQQRRLRAAVTRPPRGLCMCPVAAQELCLFLLSVNIDCCCLCSRTHGGVTWSSHGLHQRARRGFDLQWRWRSTTVPDDRLVGSSSSSSSKAVAHSRDIDLTASLEPTEHSFTAGSGTAVVKCRVAMHAVGSHAALECLVRELEFLLCLRCKDCYPSTWSAAVTVATMLRGLVKQHACSGTLPPSGAVGAAVYEEHVRCCALAPHVAVSVDRRRACGVGGAHPLDPDVLPAVVRGAASAPCASGLAAGVCARAASGTAAREG
jgi:hypothetical protein